jgi:hypothetical protein
MTLPIYLFIHIDKTAGRSFNFILRRNFGKDLVALYNLRRRRFLNEAEMKAIATLYPRARCVSSHHLSCPIPDPGDDNVEYRTMAFLRDPADRVLSTYFFQAGHRDRNKGPEFHMPRLMEHIDHVNEKEYEESSGEWASFANLQTYFLDRDYDVERAKKRMGEQLFFVGVTERFEESVLILRRKFQQLGVNFRIHYVQRNVGGRLDAGRYLSREVYDKVMEMNRMDQRLHAHANHLLDREIEIYGDRFQSDLADFKRKQRLLRLLADPARLLNRVLRYRLEDVGRSKRI